MSLDWFLCLSQVFLIITLPKTNSCSPLENGCLEDEMSFWDGLFSVDMLVSRKVMNG